MKSSVKTVLIVGASLVVGYVAGSLISWPNVNSDLLSGDIGKSNKFNKDVVSPEIKAFQEKLLADKDFQDQMVTSYSALGVQVTSFSNLLGMSIDATKDYPEFKNINEQMSDMLQLSLNAKSVSIKTMMAIDSLLHGNVVPEYEQLSNDAIMAYMQIEGRSNIGTTFVNNVDAYLKGKNLNNYKYMAFVRDQWVSYMMLGAILNAKTDALNYWKNYKPICSEQYKEDIANQLTDEQLVALYGSSLLESQVAKSLNNKTSIENGKQLGFVVLDNQQVFEFTTALEEYKKNLGIRTNLGFKNQEKIGALLHTPLGVKTFGDNALGMLLSTENNALGMLLSTENNALGVVFIITNNAAL